MRKRATSFKHLWRRACLRLFGLAAAGLVAATPAFAADAASEQSMRAVLVYNFIKFTEWSTAASDPQLRVCIASGDPAQIAALEALDERRVRGKPLEAVRFRRQADCDVIYVDSRQRWKEIAAQPAAGHILTVGGYVGFVADGGMIEIALQESGARFDINLQEAKRAGLRFYPQLLRLARRIVE